MKLINSFLTLDQTIDDSRFFKFFKQWFVSRDNCVNSLIGPELHAELEVAVGVGEGGEGDVGSTAEPRRGDVTI